MKQILLTIILFVTMPLSSVAECAADWIDLRERVKTLRAELSRQGAYAFVTNHATTPPMAPYIHSQCWVDWLPKTNVEQIAYEQEKRARLGDDLRLDRVRQHHVAIRISSDRRLGVAEVLHRGHAGLFELRHVVDVQERITVRDDFHDRGNVPRIVVLLVERTERRGFGNGQHAFTHSHHDVGLAGEPAVVLHGSAEFGLAVRDPVDSDFDEHAVAGDVRAAEFYVTDALHIDVKHALRAIDEDSTLWKLVTALYRYHQAADTYFGR